MWPLFCHNPPTQLPAFPCSYSVKQTTSPEFDIKFNFSPLTRDNIKTSHEICMKHLIKVLNLVNINLSVSDSMLFLDNMSCIFMFDVYQCLNYFGVFLNLKKED